MLPRAAVLTRAPALLSVCGEERYAIPLWAEFRSVCAGLEWCQRSGKFFEDLMNPCSIGDFHLTTLLMRSRKIRWVN